MAGWRGRDTCRGTVALVGGVLVHLSLGTAYTSGNMIPYMVSYIRAYSKPDSLRYSDGVWIFALAAGMQGFAMFFGGMLNHKIGPRWTSLLGGWLMSLGVFLSYFSISWSYYALLFTYGIVFGIGIGFAYAPPLVCGMKWLPDHKGLVSGIIVAGFGGGSFIFSQVQTAFINPGNLSPDLPYQPGSDEKYFSADKAADLLHRVPQCFLLLGGCYAALQLIGVLLLVDPPALDGEHLQLLDDNDNGEESVAHKQLSTSRSQDADSSDDSYKTVIVEPSSMSPREMLQTRAFYTLWFMFLCLGQGVVFISNLYKTYGQTFIADDHFLATLGAFSSVFNAGGRILWGRIVDRFPFKVTMMCMCTVFFTFMITLTITEAGGKAMFFIWVCMIFLGFSGSYSLFPTAVAHTFGPRYMDINYGLLFTSQTVTGPLGAVIASTLTNLIGWFPMFCLVSGFIFIAFLLALSFKEKSSLHT